MADFFDAEDQEFVLDSGHLLLTAPTRSGKGRCCSVSACKYGSSSSSSAVLSVRDCSLTTDLSYSVGVMDRHDRGGETDWGHASTAVKGYDSGQTPCVALYRESSTEDDDDDADIYAVECHSSEVPDALKVCHCRLGKVNVEKRLVDWKWGGSFLIGNGLKPRVCVNGEGRVVFVMEEMCSVQRLRYLVGRIDVQRRTIDFGYSWVSQRVDFRGVEPDVAIYGDKVFVVYRSAFSSRVKYVSGTLVEGNLIEWRKERKFEHYGKTPTISIDPSNGKVVEMHRSCVWKRLNFRVGTIVGGQIVWGELRRFVCGEFPTVALCESGQIIEMHTAPVGFDLIYSQGQLVCPK